MNFYKLVFLGLGICSYIHNTAYALKINVQEQKGFSVKQQEKLNQAVTILNQVLNSAEFKEKVLTHQYQGQAQFVQNGGMTNLQVYEFLMGGAEQFPKKQPANNLADMFLSIYYPRWGGSSAVAFTSQTDPYLNIYNSYANSATVEKFAGTIFHEWTHKLGFEHDSKSTSRRPYSVPYGVGTIVTDLVSKYIK